MPGQRPNDTRREKDSFFRASANHHCGPERVSHGHGALLTFEKEIEVVFMPRVNGHLAQIGLTLSKFALLARRDRRKNEIDPQLII